MRNIFAYTAVGVAPEFVSINIDDDGKVNLTARGVGDDGGNTGTTVTVNLTPEILRKMAEQLHSSVCWK